MPGELPERGGGLLKLRIDWYIMKASWSVELEKKEISR